MTTATQVDPAVIEARTATVKHFLNVAGRGRRRGCSGGERRARILARAIAQNVPGLDATAQAGAIELIRWAAAQPSTVRDLVD